MAAISANVLQSWIQVAQTTTDFQLIRAVQETIVGIAQQVPQEEGLGLAQIPNSRDATFDSLRRIADNPRLSERLIQALGARLEEQTAELIQATPPPPHESISLTSKFDLYQKMTTSGPEPGVVHLLKQTAAAFLRDPNRSFDPLVSPGATRVLNHPPAVRKIQEGTKRLMTMGWSLRTDAIRDWANLQLQNLPESQEALKGLLADIQWFRASVASQLEPLLSSFVPTNVEKEGLYKAILGYHDTMSRWLDTYNQTHKGTADMSRLDVEFALERENWEEARSGGAAMPLLSEPELIARGLSPLALKVLTLEDKNGERAPIQALPEGTIRYILTENPHLRGTPEALALLDAAEKYHGSGKRPTSKLIGDYVAAMRALLADPVRSQHFLIDLSFVDTARNLMLQDPVFVVEKILKEHMDQIFSIAAATEPSPVPLTFDSVKQSLETAVSDGDSEAIRVARVNLEQVRSQLGRRATQFLFNARDDLEKAQAAGNTLKIAQAKQIHDNVLSVIMFHFGHRIIPHLAVHPRYAHLRSKRPGMNDLKHLREELYREREKLARTQHSKWEGSIERVNAFWNDLYDPGLARLHLKVFQYLMQFADELMDQVRLRAPATYQQLEGDYRHAGDRAKAAIKEFVDWPKGANFIPVDYNRAIERVLQALLGTSPEWPSSINLLSKKARNSIKNTELTPGVFEVVRRAMTSGKVPGSDFHPVVPLFSAFASNYRPISEDEKKRVGWVNPKHALAGLTGGLLADLYAGERRGDGNDYGDRHLLEWAATIGTDFHQSTVVADPLTVGAIFVHFSAPVIDQKHESWSDFFTMLQISLAVSPKTGDPIRMRASRIMAKAGLDKKIPVMGSGIKHFTLPVAKGVWRGTEVRAARAIAHGDVHHDLGMVERVRGLVEGFQKVIVSSRPGPRPIGVFSEITMPVPDAINPYDPTLEGALAIPSTSSPLPPIGRGTYISLMAEAITGKPQTMIWPVANGSFATFPKPDNRIRLYRGKVRTVIPDPIFNDSIPGWASLSSDGLSDFLSTVGNLQRSVWWIYAMVPENQTPAPQEAEYLGNHSKEAAP